MSGKSCENCADIGKASCAECDDYHQWQPRITRRDESKRVVNILDGLNYHVVEIVIGKLEGYKVKPQWRFKNYQDAVDMAVDMARTEKKNYYVMAIRAKIAHVSERIVSVDEIPLWMDH